jgi:hypothetical protein
MNRKQIEESDAGKGRVIRARVPEVIKQAVKAISDARYTTESEIAREALLEYLVRRNLIKAPAIPTVEPADQPAEPTENPKQKHLKRT